MKPLCSSLLVILVCFLSACKQKEQSPEALTMAASNPMMERPEFAKLDSTKRLQTIAFGSCNRQDLPQPMWEFILKENPDLWIWLGDNIYGDSEDMSVLKKKYEQQLDNPAYQKLYGTVPLIGIWDDHDYGANDAGKEYPKRKEAQALMMDFLNVPDQAPQRKREGAYSSYTLGPDSQSVKIILLDARYFRDQTIRKGKKYAPNKEGDILGEAQWTWLEQELKTSTAKVHLIGSGIQIIPKDHRFEKWANFPNARKRLLDLIADSQVPNPILLSGDRHIGEISKLEMENGKHPIYELTSSGLTHSYESAKNEKNQYRISKLIGEKNFGVLQLEWEGDQVKLTAHLKGLENKGHDTKSLD